MQHHDPKTSPVTRLLAESLTGQVSRREILRRAGALGLSAPLVGLMLSARTKGAAAQQAPGYTIVVPEVRTDLAGTNISFILGDDGPGRPFEEAVVAKFIEATGINLERIAGPQQATERLAQYQQLLGAEASDIDGMMIDIIWPGIVAQHAVDLSEALAAQGAEYLERLVQNNTVDGVLVGIPWYTDAPVLYYRTDLLPKYGFENPPATWTELTSMAQTIQDGERASNPDFFGFVWQGDAYEGLTCDALEWQASYGGGEIITAEGEVTVNNEQTIAAFEQAKSWVGTISPEGVTTYNEEESRGVWQAGNAAFMRNWPYAYSLGQEAGSAIAGKFDVGQLPAGEGPDARSAATLGGWQMMVSKYSENQEAAIEFAKFITSPNIQKSYAIERSLLPTIPALYDDPEVAAVNPYYARLRDVFQGGAVARPSTPSADLYNEISTAYFTAVNEILTGSADAAERVEELQGELEDIMADV